MSKLGQLAIFSPRCHVTCSCYKVSGVIGEQVCYIWCYCSHSLILVTGSSTWHLMAKNSLRIWKKRIVALHKDKKIAKTLKLSCSTVAKTIQWFNRTGSTQNRPGHGRPNKLSARAQHHIQRLCLGNRRMSTASIAAEVEGAGGSVCQCSDHTPHTASNWSAWLSSQKEASSKDDAQESLQTVCWRQAD